MRPRVLFLHQGAELYGSDVIFHSIVKHATADVEPHVVLDQPGPLVERIRELAVPLTIRPIGVLRRKHFSLTGGARLSAQTASAVAWLTRYIRRHRISLVYSNTMAVVAGGVAAKLTGRPHITHAHEILVKPRWFARALPRITLALSDRVVAVSGPVRDFITAAQPRLASKVVVIHNGISTTDIEQADGDGIRREFDVGADEFLIVLVGRIHFWKGQDVIVHAAKAMVDRGFRSFRVLLVGDVYPGYEELLDRLKADVEALGLADNVTFCGFRSDAGRFFKAADVAVLPSTLPDPLPTVVLEAMAAGKPVVATAHGGALEMVDDGVTGFAVPPGNAQALAEKLMLLSGDASLRHWMGNNGCNRVHALFSEARFRDDIRRVVRAAIPGSRSL